MKLDRITSHPNRMNGQPCIRNLRLTVRRVIELLATYPDREELHQEFPELEEDDIHQALIFVASYLDDRIIELPTHMPLSPEQQEKARQKFKHHAGSIDLGYATGSDNDQIDADLARAYAKDSFGCCLQISRSGHCPPKPTSN